MKGNIFHDDFSKKNRRFDENAKNQIYICLKPNRNFAQRVQLPGNNNSGLTPNYLPHFFVAKNIRYARNLGNQSN